MDQAMIDDSADRLDAQVTLVVSGDPYCVYAHSHDGQVFYIGQGTLSRRFELHNRNDKWKAYVKTLRTITVHILRTFPTAGEARAAEAEFLELNKPCCNLTATGRLRGDTSWPVRGGEQGLSVLVKVEKTPPRTQTQQLIFALGMTGAISLVVLILLLGIGIWIGP